MTQISCDSTNDMNMNECFWDRQQTSELYVTFYLLTQIPRQRKGTKKDISFSLSLSHSWLLSALLSLTEIRCTPDWQTLYWYFDSDCSALTPVLSHCVKLDRVTQPRMQRRRRVLSIVLCNTVTISKLHSTSKVDTNCTISI